tara:strand:- start:25494 stop:25634 length:141 start_codon:yes stop_codon:yes gene_type:complete
MTLKEYKRTGGWNLVKYNLNVTEEELTNAPEVIRLEIEYYKNHVKK